MIIGTGSWSAAGGNWSSGSNWSTGWAPNGRGQGAVLNNAVAAISPLSVMLDVPVTLGTLVLGNSDGTATAGFDISAAGANALSLDNSGSTSQITVQAGTHVISAPITLAANLDVVPSPGSTLTISGNISQSAASSLTLSNAGTLILSGSNSYTGPTTISAGTLQIGNGGAAGSLSSGTASAITDNGTLVFNCSGTVTQGTNFSSAAIKGNGSLVQAGPGTLVLTDTNSFTGGTTVDGGTLQLNVGGENGTLDRLADRRQTWCHLGGKRHRPPGLFRRRRHLDDQRRPHVREHRIPRDNHVAQHDGRHLKHRRRNR